jgi:uncharacterized protein
MPVSPDDQPYLIGNRCNMCGNAFFPYKGACPICLTDETLEWIPMGKRGTISSFSILHVAHPGFTVPHIQAMVKLDEGPLIFSLITNCPPEPDALYIGQPVKLCLGPIRNQDKGEPVIGWMYEPVGGINP